METIIIKRDKRLRKQNVVISVIGLMIFLPIAVAVKDLSVFLTIFLGLIGSLYLYSFIRDKYFTEEPAEIIFSDTYVFFNSIGNFAWDEILEVELERSSSNEFNEISNSTYLHISLQNRKSFSFPISLLEKNENEIMSLFIMYKSLLGKSHF